jgi:nucleoside-diphosphate-sugar epimerase
MMNNDERLHVVLGASGGLGSAVVWQLVQKGKRIRAVSRSAQRVDLGHRIEVVRGDITDPAQMSTICQGASVIYHCANAPYPEWRKALPPMMDAVIRAADTSGAKVVYGDNLYMYGRVSGLITPDLPVGGASSKKLKPQLAQELDRSPFFSPVV